MYTSLDVQLSNVFDNPSSRKVHKHPLPVLIILISLFSLSRDQTGSLHSGHYVANVQNSGPQRPSVGLQSERVILGRRQVFGHPSYSTRPFAGRLFPFRFQIQG